MGRTNSKNRMGGEVGREKDERAEGGGVREGAVGGAGSEGAVCTDAAVGHHFDRLAH